MSLLAETRRTEQDLVSLQTRVRTRRKGPLTTWVAFGMTRALGALLVTGVLPYSNRINVTEDVNLYGFYARLLQTGHLPYRDFDLEYPPGILPLLGLPTSSWQGFRGEFLLAALIADAAVLTLLLWSGRERGSRVWVAAAVLVGPIWWARLDVFVAAALVAAVVAWERKRPAAAGSALAFAALLKLWPVLLLPGLFVALRSTSQRVRLLAGAAGTASVFVLPLCVVGGGPGLLRTLRYHQRRGLEIESLAATPLHVYQAVHRLLPLDQSFGSVDFARPMSTPFLVAAEILTLVCWVSFLGTVSRRRGPRPSAAAMVLALVALTLATSKVLSPQYDVWLASACALAIGEVRRHRALLVAAAVMLGSAQVLYPFQFEASLHGSWTGVTVVLVHSASTAAVAWLSLRHLTERRRLASDQV